MVVVRKNVVVSQAKDVRNAHCPGACMKGKRKGSAGWNISITLDDANAFSVWCHGEEERVKDVPWMLSLVRFGWRWMLLRCFADVLGKSGRVCVSWKIKYWQTNPSIHVVSWVEESCSQSNPAFRATCPVWKRWHGNRGGRSGCSRFLTFAHRPSHPLRPLSLNGKRSVYVPVETNDKLASDTGIP